MTEGVTLWRVSNYASMDGTGGLYVSGRWHSKGRPVVYCSEDPSTALLETLVHMEIEAEDWSETFQVLKIESSRDVSIEQLAAEKFGADWRSNLTATQSAGNEWLRSGRTLLLEVPSILVPERRNYLINPSHPEMKRLRMTAIYAHHSIQDSSGNATVMRTTHHVGSETHWTEGNQST